MKNTGSGIISIVGLGPGNREQMTIAAVDALKNTDVIAGYTGYLKLMPEFLKEKTIISTGMKKETDRVRMAIAAAREGKRVAVVSSGDAGIYGMAGLILENLNKYDRNLITINIIPGITAAVAAASIVGAPLMNDFAVISLSNLLTDESIIKKRVNAAIEGDFVTVLYNPKSKKRQALIKKVLEIFKKKRTGNTPVAIVQNAYRNEQKVNLLTLQNTHPDSSDINMFSVIIIGNSSSLFIENWFITLRGYEKRLKNYA